MFSPTWDYVEEGVEHVTWHVENWHIEMDEAVSDIVGDHIHEGFIYQRILERVERPLLGIRDFGFRMRMAQVVNG